MVEKCDRCGFGEAQLLLCVECANKLSFGDLSVLYLGLLQLKSNIDFVDKKILLLQKLAKMLEKHSDAGMVKIWLDTGALDPVEQIKTPITNEIVEVMSQITTFATVNHKDYKWCWEELTRRIKLRN